MDIQIVDATGDDVEDIRRVQILTWIDTYPNEKLGITKEKIKQRFDRSPADIKKSLEARRKTILENSSVHNWVAKEKSKLVGFCIATKEDGNRVAALYVLPNYQGQGVGYQLIKVALYWLGNEKDIYVYVASYNQKAINFYEQVGFKKTGKQLTEKVGKLPSGEIIPELEMVLKR